MVPCYWILPPSDSPDHPRKSRTASAKAKLNRSNTETNSFACPAASSNFPNSNASLTPGNVFAPYPVYCPGAVNECLYQGRPGNPAESCNARSVK